MATLYTLRESNIRKTWVYLAGFLILVISLGWFFSYYFESPEVFWFVFTFGLIVNFLSYWFSDKIVIGLARAKPIEKRDNPELYRLVENLCLTAGLPLPKIYITNDQAPNAFATGRNPENSAIVVTQGLLDKLERRELEGVISHELAHIGNRDTLLATLVVALTGLIIRLIDLFFRMGFRGGRKSRDRGNAPFMVLGLVLLILAPIMAQLLRFAISRKREFLADATGALLTRYPEGLALALEKISRDPRRLKTATNATAHLYIVNPFKGEESKKLLVRLFSTHPSLEERIGALRQMEV